MNTINAILIDDEAHNRNTLRTLLASWCPDIKVAGEASGADQAFTMVNELKPQLVFLDVMMPVKSGFDFLKMFSTINFEVIFVSAFNEHAVTAFEYNALGYILKPVDYNKLISCVNKAILRIGLSSQNNSVLQFIKTLDPHADTIAKIVVHHNEKVVLVNIAEIVSLKSDNGVCEITLVNNDHYFSSRDLKLFEDILGDSGNFARISKNTVINLDLMRSYQKGEVCIIKMVNGTEFEVSRRKKTEILRKIKMS